MKEYKNNEFPSLILRLVDLFAKANHDMSLMKDWNSPDREKFYSDAYSELANELKKLEVLMLDSDEVEIMGPNKKMYKWTRTNPTVVSLDSPHHGFGCTVSEIFSPELVVKQFSMNEIPRLCEGIRTLLRPYLSKFQLLENMAGEYADELNSELYNSLYNEIKRMGVIMISDNQVQIKTEKNRYYLWDYKTPEVIYPVKKNGGRYIEFDNNKIYLDEL